MFMSGSTPPRPRIIGWANTRWKCFSQYPFYVAGFGNTPEEAYYDWLWSFRDLVNSY